MNKRFKVACLATLTVGMLAVNPAQAGFGDWRNQIISGISGMGMFAASMCVKSMVLSGNLAMGGIPLLAYSFFSSNNKRKANNAAKFIIAKKETVSAETPIEFSMSKSNVTLPVKAPIGSPAAKVKINVWLKNKELSVVDIKSNKTCLINSLLNDSTPKDKCSSAKIDLNGYNIAFSDKSNDKKKKENIYQAVYQELTNLTNTKNRLGNVLWGSLFVTKLNGYFSKELNKICNHKNYKGLYELNKDDENTFFINLNNFRDQYLEGFSLLEYAMPNVKHASGLYIETFRREQEVRALVIILAEKWKIELGFDKK